MLFAFTLYHAILDYRNGMIIGNPNSPLLFILYRDGFYYFAALSVFHSWNALQVSTYNSTRCSFLEMRQSHCLPIVSLGAEERVVNGRLLCISNEHGNK
jgi:hypothetical protein